MRRSPVWKAAGHRAAERKFSGKRLLHRVQRSLLYYKKEHMFLLRFPLY